MMTLDDALIDMAQRFGLNATDLIQYSYEDDHSGWDKGVGEWPVGSLWTVEGRVLYALTRALQPEVIIEIGTNVGCSATHFASALKANGHGKVISFDTASVISIPGTAQTYPQGGLIPEDVREYVELVNADGLDYLEKFVDEIDMIYEDCDHSTISTQRAWIAGKDKLVEGGVLLSHDAAHWLVGKDIRQGIINAGVEATIYAISPSDCGLAAWRKPMDNRIPVPQHVSSKTEIPLSAFVPNGDGEQVAFDYQFDKPKRSPQPELDEMSLRELKDYADEHDVPLGSARTKSAIIAKIREA